MAHESTTTQVDPSQAPLNKNPNKETPQDVLDWAQSFHHETPPMFRRRFEESTGPMGSLKVVQKLVDYESDSEEDSAETMPAGVTTTSSTSHPFSFQEPIAHLEAAHRPTSTASDPGPDRDVAMKDESQCQSITSVDPAVVTELNTPGLVGGDSAGRYRLEFAGPAYPTVRQPSLPDITNISDPGGVAARRLAKYQSFCADDNFLQAHLHPIAEQHFGPRFHTRFFVKTIGTIMCDQCKQKNNGEMYKCHTCTNQICRACVEERLQREQEEGNNPPSHGEEPYEWEWNGKARHEGFKLCYLQRKEKANGQGDYSIPFVGVVDGKDVLEGTVEMIVSDVQGGRKRKGPPTATSQDKFQLRAIKVEDDQSPTSSSAPLKEKERVQQMVFGKKSATLAKLTRIQELAQAAVANGRSATHKSVVAGARHAKGYHRHAMDMLAQEQQGQFEYGPHIFRTHMLPAVAQKHALPSKRQIRVPAAAPESPYVATFEEAQRRGHVAPHWDGRGLPPYEYHPYRDINRQLQSFRDQPPARGRTLESDLMAPQRARPGTPVAPDGRSTFTGPAAPSWQNHGQPYLMSDAEWFQAQMLAQQEQYQATAGRHIQAQGMPMYAAGAVIRDRSRMPDPFRNPYEVMMEGSPKAAATRSTGSSALDARPLQVVSASQGRVKQRKVEIFRTKEKTADQIDPSSMLPDDPTIFIPRQYRVRPEREDNRWDALVNAANFMYQLDLDKLDGVAIGQLTPAQLDAVKQAARQAQQQSRDQVARLARQRAAAGDAVVIDDDGEVEVASRDAGSQQGRRRSDRRLWARPEGDSGRLRSGKEFTS